jgi:predicted helicase
MAAAAHALAQQLVSEHASDADTIAQAAVCAQPILASQPHHAHRVINWLAPTLAPWEHHALALAANSPPLPFSPFPFPHTYDLFLHHYGPSDRRRHGVFFTPEPIARHIVTQIDRLLTDDFDLPGGLSSISEVALLDPACGTGIFFLAVIDHLHAHLKQRGADWNEFVPQLLSRLIGIELLPVPGFLTKLNIAVRMAATGYNFSHPAKLKIHTGDALDPNLEFAICSSQCAIPVVLGNPPFSSLTTPSNPWIARLVRGDDEMRGYMQAGDLRLGERKTWLHDDYVKFIRLAQWHVEQAGLGIVAFITNHGYLDNATFRLMRHELARVFSQIEIIDLHGSRKNGKAAPNGARDENVFGLDQGVAIGLFATRRVSESVQRVKYGELWGTREEKLAALEGTSSLTRRVPLTPPHWRFVPTENFECPAYDAAWPLTEVMPVNASAPVTARDHFLVAFTEEELHARVAEFCDLTIPDDEIRGRYFTRTRSRRYPPGDTRGWKLSAARQAVAADDAWPRHIRRCLYRPFDWRYVFWHPAMIDWPRNEVTRHLVAMTNDQAPSPESEVQNLCLIARRQQLPTQACTFFWISDGLALDGVIRSDNRGSESLFPLWLAGDDGRANFAPAFVAQFEGLLGHLPAAEDLLGYIYALFHSPTYRERFASRLRESFPRVLFPAVGGLFESLATVGRELIELHLLRPNVDTTPSATAESPVSLRIGGYDLPRKWLQPKQRTDNDANYARIVTAIKATLPLMQQIDKTIARHGGFPAAFAGGNPLSQHC